MRNLRYIPQSPATLRIFDGGIPRAEQSKVIPEQKDSYDRKSILNTTISLLKKGRDNGKLEPIERINAEIEKLEKELLSLETDDNGKFEEPNANQFFATEKVESVSKPLIIAQIKKIIQDLIANVKKAADVVKE